MGRYVTLNKGRARDDREGLRDGGYWSGAAYTSNLTFSKYQQAVYQPDRNFTAEKSTVEDTKLEAVVLIEEGVPEEEHY